MTPGVRLGSRFFCVAITLVISGGCNGESAADPRPKAHSVPPDLSASALLSEDPDAAPEACLGVSDKGIWNALDSKVQITLPAAAAERFTAAIDRKHGVLVLSLDGFPRKSYPLGGDGATAT